jgi:hypothetical protein
VFSLEVKPIHCDKLQPPSWKPILMSAVRQTAAVHGRYTSAGITHTCGCDTAASGINGRKASVQVELISKLANLYFNECFTLLSSRVISSASRFRPTRGADRVMADRRS